MVTVLAYGGTTVVDWRSVELSRINSNKYIYKKHKQQNRVDAPAVKQFN